MGAPGQTVTYCGERWIVFSWPTITNGSVGIMLPGTYEKRWVPITEVSDAQWPTKKVDQTPEQVLLREPSLEEVSEAVEQLSLLDPEPPTHRDPTWGSKVAGPNHAGSMIALYPDAETAARMSEFATEPPDELHITLAYLPDSTQFTISELAAAVKTVTDKHLQPLEGMIGGLGRFNPSESAPGGALVALIDIPGLEDVRHELMVALEDFGLFDQVSTSHGFTPHMTLRYLEKGQNPDMGTDLVSDMGHVPLTFDSIWVVRGGIRMEIPFGKIEITASFEIGLPLHTPLGTGKMAGEIQDEQGQWLLVRLDSNGQTAQFLSDECEPVEPHTSEGMALMPLQRPTGLAPNDTSYQDLI